MKNESEKNPVLTLKDFCLEERKRILLEVTKLDANCVLDAEATVKKAIVDLLEAGGIELAQSLLLEKMPFDDGNEAVRRLSQIQQWCEAQQAEPDTPPTKGPLSGIIEVYDKSSAKNVPFNTAGLEQWGPASYGDNWSPLDDYFLESVEEYLFRHDKQLWTLLSQTTHQEFGIVSRWDATRISDEEAMGWFASNEIDPPSDVAEVMSSVAFQPGLPEEKPETDDDVDFWSTFVANNDSPDDASDSDEEPVTIPQFARALQRVYGVKGYGVGTVRDWVRAAEKAGGIESAGEDPNSHGPLYRYSDLRRIVKTKKGATIALTFAELLEAGNERNPL